MSKKESCQWLSAYLYYNEPWESFLVDAVLPYVKTTLQTGIAHKYFFIRYWERGPHLRLRLCGEPALLQEVLRPNLIEHFGSYFERLPSPRTEPEYPPRLPDEFKWYPNNSIQFIEYQPEWERYGGEAGLELAEETFFQSSQIVLENIAQRVGAWTYDDALGLAIKLHLSMAFGLGMKQEEAQAFFQFYFYNWLPRAFRRSDQRDNRRDRESQERETLQAFAESYDQQKEVLVAYHRELWQALEQGVELEEKILEEWMSYHQQLAENLLNSLLEKRFQNRPLHYQFNNTAKTIVPALEKQRWMQYADFLHLTNNRLGVLNRDEGYLAYLIMKSMEEF